MSTPFVSNEANAAAIDTWVGGSADTVQMLLAVRAAALVVERQVRERIAAELERVPDEVYPEDVFGGPISTDDFRRIAEVLKADGLPSLDHLSANIMRRAFRMAARDVRDLA